MSPFKQIDTKWTGGLTAMLGCNYKALAYFRISLGFLLTLELILRFRFLHVFYSDEGTLPLRILLPKIDSFYRVLCVHAYFGSLLYEQILLSIQVVFAFFLMVGYKCELSAVLSWFLYLSLTLRNTWLNFILDRYFHYMLFYAMFLPLEYWSVDSFHKTKKNVTSEQQNNTIVSIATIAIKAHVLWIYLDAGYGKYSDPLGGWTYNADPLPALDTYARHTLAARYLYALLTPKGLRIMTPMVVYLELFSAPIVLIASYLGNRRVAFHTILLICSLHFGIALTVRNTVLLSSVACAAWCVFLPPSEQDCIKVASTNRNTKRSFTIKEVVQSILIVSMIMGSVWFETMSGECNQSMKHIWSTLLHNRWNVFIGAEEYVTWEIAPGRLANGKVVDVWGRSNEVNWDMPVAGAPCTSTARPGRWRSFPYLAELKGEEGEALWSYLCRQWDYENNVHLHGNEGQKLLRYNFFMLQADVLPNMGFTATRKRLIHSHDCTKNEIHTSPEPSDNSNSNEL